MEDQKCHMQRVVAVPESAGVLCVAVVLEQLRGTPEPFSMMPASAKGGEGSTRTWAAVLLMGHLDVWAYVIQSQRAASNRPPIAGIQLCNNRSAASLLHPGGHGSGNRSRQGPEVSHSPSTSPSLNTHTHAHTHSTVPLPLQLLA